MCLCAGEIKWQQPQPAGLRSTVPVLSVPDLDGDKVDDVALVASDNTQVTISDIIYYIYYYLFSSFPSYSASIKLCSDSQYLEFVFLGNN